MKDDRLKNKMISWTNRQLKKLNQEKPSEETLVQRITHFITALSTELETADVADEALKS